MKKIGIVVCSNAGTDYFDLGYPIEVMRSSLILDGKEYKDYIDITADEFYRRASEEENLKISTAQCPVGVMTEILNKMADNGNEDIIAIVISKEFSGIYQSVHIASEMVNNAKVHVIDSKSVSFGQLFLVQETIKMIKEGKNTDEIVERLLALREKIEVLVVVDTLKFLVKNGRLSVASGLIGTLLKIKPILRINRNGKLETYEKIRTKKRAVERVLEIFKTETFNREVEICLCYTNNLESVKELESKLLEIKPGAKVSYIPLSPVVGAHAGPGTLGLGYVYLDWNKLILFLKTIKFFSSSLEQHHFILIRLLKAF